MSGDRVRGSLRSSWAATQRLSGDNRLILPELPELPEPEYQNGVTPPDVIDEEVVHAGVPGPPSL